MPPTRGIQEILRPREENRLARFLEPAATMASATVAEPVSGIAALLTGNPENIQRVQQALTYNPRTREGQEGLKVLSETFQQLTEALGVDEATKYFEQTIVPNLQQKFGDEAGSAMGAMAMGALAVGRPGRVKTRTQRAEDLGFDMDNPLYHGSTHDISEMKPDNLNPESHFGRAYYTTTSPDDASRHYGGEGPDLSGRIQQRAESLASELEDQFDDWDSAYEAAKDIARKELKGGTEGVIYPLVGRSEKVFDMSKDGDTFLAYDRRQLDPKDYLDEADGDMDLAEELAFDDSYNFEPEGDLVEFIDAIKWDSRIDDSGKWKLIEKIEEKALDYGGIKAKDLDDIMRNTEFWAEDDIGSYLNSEVYRQALEKAGFDSIVHDADIFPGMDIESGTKHQIFFKPEQLRSKNARFDPNKIDSADLLSALSKSDSRRKV